MRTARRAAIAAVTVVVLAALVLPGAAGLAAPKKPAGDKNKLVLNVGIPGDMVSPNPFKACCSYEYEMFFLNYDMLFNFSPKDLTPSPGLAKSCDHSEDFKTWTCDIRSGVKWSDGQPLTAADVAFTYNFIVKNNLSAFTDYLPFDPSFSAPNATTLIWKSTKPTFAPEVPPWVPILPEHIWKRFDGDPKGAKSFENVPAVGSGPFHLVEWKPGQFFRMEANKHYWGGTPTIDEVVFHVFDNNEAMVQSLKAGDVDFIDDLNPTLFNALKGQPDIATHEAAPSYFYNVAFNFGGQGKNATNNPALKDLRVRQAIQMGIDKKAIVDKVFQGDALVGSTVTIPGSPWHYVPPTSKQIPFDPPAANTLLDKAGYRDTNGDGIREAPGGKDPLKLDFLTINNVSGSNDEGKLIKDQLKQIGIDINLIPVTEGKAYSLWAEGDYDAYLWDWGGDPDPDFILSIFTTHSCLVWSDGCFSDKTYDKMYEQQRTIFDRSDRKVFIDKMQQYLYDKIPEIVTVYPFYLQAYRTDRFTGYVPTPQNGGALLFGWGPYSYINMRPVSANTTASSGEGGMSAAVWVGIAAAVILIAVGLVIFRRRRVEEEA
jgi:peptide/nickel transport system substrate-binding protein